MAASRVYVFGPFHYDAEQRLLFRQGEVVPLVPKAIDTLHVLLERRGRVVEKAELMKLVWPDTTVEEVRLARNISLLRKALDDESGQYIETIPRRGYRFVAEAPTEGPGVRGQGPGKRGWLALAGGVVVLGGSRAGADRGRAGSGGPGGGAPGDPQIRTLSGIQKRFRSSFPAGMGRCWE
jgi:DNA-binding winged helix-turn-helix (wHTH) protein